MGCDGGLAPHHTSWRSLALGSVLFLCASGGAVAETAHEQALEVSVEEDRLSVEVGAVPLADVLQAIAEQTGAKLLVRGDPGMVHPQAFMGRPLADGVRQLVGRNSLAMIFAPATGPDPSPRLVALTVHAATALGKAAAEPAQQSSQASPQESRANLPSLSDFARGGDERLVTALSHALVRDPDALKQGGVFEHPDDVDAYRAALASEDPADRIEALQEIGQDRSQRALGPLFEVLIGDEDAAVRRMAVQVLADLDSEDALAALEGALSDPDTSVRAAAAQALGH